MKYVFLILVAFITNSYANVSIEVIPQSPAVNEVFQILFKCSVENREDPEINFKAKNFEILDKQSQGISTRTTYQAGKITVNRELLISYTAIAKKTGTATILNPRIKLGSQMVNKSDVSFQVVAKPVGPKLVFVAAEVSKDEVYENEGITLRYYLYRKVGIQATDIKKYPKLDVFMKRYLQENENPQRVTINGDIFTRSTLYSARLYPEQPGEYEIDPLEISVSYSNDNLNAFGFGFGLSTRDLVTKTIASEPLKIKVKPLPSEGRPAAFSGLVGSHKFDLVVGRTNILVNEPLEMKISVNGPGKLESLEPFKLFNTSSLERFDVKADLAIINSDNAIKTFGYTFLGKANGSVPPSEIEISYFNTDTQQYEVWKSALPEIRIAGGSVAAPIPKNKTKDLAESENNKNSAENVVIVKSDHFSLIVLAVMIFLVLLFIAYKLYTLFYSHAKVGRNDEIGDTLKALTKGRYGLKELARYFAYYEGEHLGGVKDLIHASKLEESDKKFFFDILSAIEQRDRKGGNGSLPKIEAKLLKKISNMYEAQNEGY